MLLLFIVSLAWAFSFGLIKGNLTGVDSNFVSFVRMAISFVVFLPFIKIKRIDRKLFLKLALAGVMQFGIMYIAYIASFKTLKAYEVALFTIFTPIYVTLIDDAFRKKFNPLYLVTALLAVVGTWIIKSGEPLSPGIMSGFLLVQVSNLTFAFGQVYYRRLMAEHNELKDQNVFGVLYFGAVAVTLAATLIFTPLADVTLTAKQIWTLVYLGVFASGVCFFLWGIGSRKVNTGALAIFNDLKVPLAVAVSLVVFGEKTNWVTLLIGGLIVVASLVFNEWLTNKVIVKR
ncbi:MAG: EamA family transporter [Chloroflexi bacterium HGW-Chloroflexi-4]|jgi:carboxylate/amino acid/amine transporter|nr:MAG: EamA family transporter [Chloroflexi bacterium HGW-Chloroflexi-4]